MDSPGQTLAARTVYMGIGSVGADKTSTALFWPARVPPAGSDIWVTKRDSLDPAEVGKPFTYTIAATNLDRICHGGDPHRYPPAPGDFR